MVEEAEQVPKLIEGKEKLMKSPQHPCADNTSPPIRGYLGEIDVIVV